MSYGPTTGMCCNSNHVDDATMYMYIISSVKILMGYNCSHGTERNFDHTDSQIYHPATRL